MKKIILVLTLAVVGILSACSSSLDYSDLDSNHVDSFEAAETKNEDTYFIYYYSKDSVYSDNVKDDMLKFIDGFDEANFYMVDVSEMEDTSNFAEYQSVPTVFVIDEGNVYEKFESESGIENFIFQYGDFKLSTFKSTLNYADFDHIEHYDDFFNRPEDKYVIYYYSETCGYCNQIKDFMLNYAFENDAGIKMYMLDVYDIGGAYPFSEGKGTPTIFVIENGEMIYTTSGANSVPEYLRGLE